jgi:hypothetical protein
MTKFIALSLLLIATPAMADSPIRSADARVAELRGQFVKAQQSRDAATIAAARAKLGAAEATAWAARHPAPVPTATASR